MQVSVEHTSGLERRMTIQVPAERIDQEVSSRLESMSRTVRLDGFRPGKVPVRVIKQKYGDQVRQEVIEQVINSTLQEALTQENLSPAGMPSIEPQAMQQGEALEYVATFEVFPEFTEALDYGFSVSRPVVDVADSDVDDMLEKLRKQRATWNQVERAAATIGAEAAPPMLAAEAIAAVTHIATGELAPVDYLAIPMVVYSHPEVGWVGRTEAQARDGADLVAERLGERLEREFR